jgi:hypothetical protein
MPETSNARRLATTGRRTCDVGAKADFGRAR